MISGYAGAEYFCDRREELSWLREQVENGRNVVIHSWRRLGKTALIRRHFAGLRGYDCLYCDLFPTQSVEDAVERLGQAVIDKYGDMKSGIGEKLGRMLAHLGARISVNPVTGVPSMSLSMVNPPETEHSLRAIGEFLGEQKKPVVIALDEFQQVSQYEKSNAEAAFRAWAQEFPQIRIIYSGSNRTLLQAMFTERKRPFFKSAQMLPLNPIEKGEYGKFIRGHFSKARKAIGEDQIDRIYSWSRGQTYTVQLLCNLLFARCTQVKNADIQKAQVEILEQEQPVFANYKNMLTRLQWSLLKAIAQSEPLSNPLAKEFLYSFNLGSASSVNTALRALIDKELVIRENGHYLVHEVILARWFQGLR